MHILSRDLRGGGGRVRTGLSETMINFFLIMMRFLSMEIAFPIKENKLTNEKKTKGQQKTLKNFVRDPRTNSWL